MYTSQSIHKTHGVTCFGSCLIRTEPDYASARFAVARTADTPAEAFERGHSDSKNVRDFLLGFGLPDHHVRTSRITMNQSFSGYGADQKFLGYTANVGFQVHIEDLGGLEQVLVGVVGAGANLVDHVSFKTSKIKEHRERALSGAVLSARRKAEIYAEAADAEVGPVLHIEDVNPDELTRRSHSADIDLSEHDDSPLSGAENPGSIVVAGAAMVCFSLRAR